MQMISRLYFVRLVALSSAVLLTSHIAQASPINVYSATDVGAGPGSPTPNASGAASSFHSAASGLGAASTVNFESAPLGSFTSLAAGPGLTITGANYQGNNQTILNAPSYPSDPALDGFNTTAGGSQFLEVLGGTATFSFSSPTDFFGAYFTGIQSEFFTDTLTFSNGTSQSVTISNPSSTLGGVTFLGFTDAGASISQITLNAGSSSSGADFIGVDDVQYLANASPVPEPSTFALTCLPLLLVGFYAYRQRKTHQSFAANALGA